MAPASAQSLLALLLLSITGVAFAEESTTKSKDALETARRDLQAIKIEPAILPGERFPDANLSLPSFTPLTISGPSQREKSGTAEPSKGWLLDALQKPSDAQKGSLLRYDRDLRKERGADPQEAQRRQTTPVNNPLRTYVDQWLSPQDKRLLAPDTPPQNSWDRANLRRDQPLRERTESAYAPAVGTNPRQGFLTNTAGERVNPYLVPAENERLVPEPLAPLPSSNRTSTTSLAPLPVNSYSPPQDTAPTLRQTKPEETLPPPTAPLVDERRYFPQLRRF